MNASSVHLMDHLFPHFTKNTRAHEYLPPSKAIPLIGLRMLKLHICGYFCSGVINEHSCFVSILIYAQLIGCDQLVFSPIGQGSKSIQCPLTSTNNIVEWCCVKLLRGTVPFCSSNKKNIYVSLLYKIKTYSECKT